MTEHDAEARDRAIARLEQHPRPVEHLGQTLARILSESA